MKKDVIFILLVVAAGMVAITLPNRSDEDQLVEHFNNVQQGASFQGFKAKPRTNSRVVPATAGSSVSSSTLSDDGIKASRYERGLAGEETDFERSIREGDNLDLDDSSGLSQPEVGSWESVFGFWEASVIGAAMNQASFKKLESSAECHLEMLVGSTSFIVTDVSKLEVNAVGSRVVLTYSGKRISLFTSVGTKSVVAKTQRMISHCSAQDDKK